MASCTLCRGCAVRKRCRALTPCWKTPMSRSFHLAFRSSKTAVSSRLLMACGALLGVVAEPAVGQTPGQRVAPPAVLPAQVAAAEIPQTTSATDGTVHRDAQVVPAGAHLLRNRPKVCPQGGCGPGGRCQGTCVVRPGRFGYYATQWRSWPGDAGVQQTSLQQMTPVSPPASAIPSVDEEALMPSSLMPEEELAPRGSDSFGFEEVVPAQPQPQLPEPLSPEGEAPPAAVTPEEATAPEAVQQPTAPQRPSLFEEPAPTPGEATPEADTKPADDEKPRESLDNLFDDFGRQSRLRSSVELRQRLAMANQQMAQRRAENQTRVTRVSEEWKPKQFPATASSRPLGQPSAATRVMPASAAQEAASNPLR